MTPWRKEQLVAEAAVWMRYNQKKNTIPIWWTPAVLTKDNPDRSGPKNSAEDAAVVFNELFERGLLRPDEVVLTDPVTNVQRAVSVYYMQLHKERAWQKLEDEQGVWDICIRPTARYLFGHSFPLFLALAAFIASHFFSKLCENFGDDVYPKLKALWHHLVG